MGGSVWFDPSGLLPEPDALIDPEAPWLDAGDDPPAQEWVAPQVNPLASNETPPQQHPGSWGTPLDEACPKFFIYRRTDPPPCGGLKDLMLERAWNYQRASINDLPDWPATEEFGGTFNWETQLSSWTTRDLRSPSAMNIYRLLPHYAHPQLIGPLDRDGMLANAVLCMRSKSDLRSPLQTWSETADFTANGLLRLLFLYSDSICEPDAKHSTGPYPLIPCDLQNEIRKQLLGFKYFGDEPARGPNSDHEAVYWSENHQMLYATAEYLAGQLMPDVWFQPTQHRRDPQTNTWAESTDTNWGMRGSDRMARAYPRLVRWLDHRLMFGYSEWNSPVYYDYEIAGLLNLIDFCDDAAVADKATLALDLVLFDLARFAGVGRCGATSGRAYPSHKFSGWGARISEVLQILFGHWQVDRRAEEVLEDWRIEHFEAKREDGCARAAASARAQILPGVAVDPNLPDPGEAAIRKWDRDNHTSHERRRRPPINEDNPWGSADSPGAHSLATSIRYCVPDLFTEYAREPETPWFERSRVSIGFEEGKSDYGIGFTGEWDVLAWWSRGGYGAAQTIIGSRDLARSWSVQEMSPFTDIPGLFWLPDQTLVDGAHLLAVESEGSCLTNANLALWRERGAVLSSVQKFRFGQVGRQAHIWQATLDPYVGVWSTFPAATSSEDDGDGPSWWSGNASQPRVAQYEDALICIHDSTLLSYTTGKYNYRSHAWFPVRMFDEAYEVRPDEDDEDTRSNVIDLNTRVTQSSTDLAINANRGGVWWFGRKGDSYVGLFSAKPNARLETTGRWALREIRCEDRVNVFICQVGSADRFGSFNDFMKACCRARIYVALGVYKPSLPLVDIDCSYDIPGKKNLWLRLEKRWPIYDGTPLRDEDFPRWENPWISVPWRKRDYTLSHSTAGRPPVELFHDCDTGARTGTGL